VGAENSTVLSSPRADTEDLVLKVALLEDEPAEERRVREASISRIGELLLGPSSGQAWLANRLDEAAGQLREELDARREGKAEAEFEALWSSIARVQDLVLGDVGGSSSLATSMSAVAERLDG
jgi:hypothetical protein